jgi:hypothetical protein
MFKLLACVFVTCSALCSTEIEKGLEKLFFTPEITSLSISDWKQPTAEDYWKIQCFMQERHIANINSPPSDRPFPTEYLNTEFYGWLLYRNGRLGLVKNQTEMPSKHVVYCNNDPSNKKNCVISYAGCQSRGNERDYLRGINVILKSLEKLGFDGHFIYYIGGWPSLQRDRLKWVDVPFAFKPFLFEEVRDLGYENILWLDACCVPVKRLDPVFKFIQEKGLCFYSYGSKVQWREFTEGYKYLMPFLELSKRKQYDEISSQIVGLNTKDPKANQLLDEWLKAAERKIPFLQSDEPPFMYLVNHLNLNYGSMPQKFYVETPCNTGGFSYWRANHQAIIYHQYDFLNPQYAIPDELFSH